MNPWSQLHPAPQQPAAAERVAETLSALGIDSSAGQRRQLTDWLSLLARWNKACGLTAVPPAARLEQLLAVSAMALPYLRPGAVLDVGSGAGVPGIVIAVLAPDHHCTLVESNGRKANFIDCCRGVLGLSNATVENCRVEALTSKPYDNVVARAFAPLSKLLKLTWHLSGRHTRWLSFKGADAHRETRALAGKKIQSRILPLRPSGAGRPVSLVLIDRADGGG